jgi:hypothetical protein
MRVPHVSYGREGRVGLRQGHFQLFTCLIHAGGRRWRATSAKVANVLPQTLHVVKNVEAILKVLSQGVAFVIVTNNEISQK